MHDLSAITSRTLRARAIIAVVAVLMLVLGWFAVRWQIGNLLADLTDTADPNAAEISLAVRGLAPSDPMAWRLAASATYDTAEAVKFNENAVRLAPNDYRWRIDLARALEQNDETERAEREFKRARELAPEYAAPQWHLGNFYLRQNREAEALAELKLAAAHNQTYRDQVFSLLWDYFQKDPARIEAIVEVPAARAHLAYFLAARGSAEAALRNWGILSDADKERYRYRAVNIADGLYIQRYFDEALGFAKYLGNALDAEPEKVTNPSFESPIGDAERSRFGWQIYRTEPKMEVTTDGKVQHSGSRSMRVTFRGFAKPTFTNILQTIVVQPNRSYSLSFWVRTEELRSAGTPMLEILNGVDDKPIVRSQPFAAGTADWQRVTLDFRSPDNCRGVIIRTIRNYCGDECPITGTFWYDDIELVQR